MNHKLTDGGHVLHVGTLARVEGEGAMHVEVRDGRVSDVQLQIYEPPRFYEAFLRGRSLHRTTRHHRPDLRHLPGGLPDERLLGDRGRLRRRRARGDPAAAPAALLRRVDREPRAARLPAARARLPRLRRRHRDGRRPPRRRRAGAAAEEGRQPAHDLVGGRAIHPVNVRVGGFYRVPTVAELRALRPDLERALDEALATVRAGGRLRLPDFERPRVRRAARRDGYAIEAGSVVTTTGGGIRGAATSPRNRGGTSPHSNALHARLDGGGRGPTSSARWPGTP